MSGTAPFWQPAQGPGKDVALEYTSSTATIIKSRGCPDEERALIPWVLASACSSVRVAHCLFMVGTRCNAWISSRLSYRDKLAHRAHSCRARADGGLLTALVTMSQVCNSPLRAGAPTSAENLCAHTSSKLHNKAVIHQMRKCPRQRYDEIFRPSGASICERLWPKGRTCLAPRSNGA